MASRAGVAPVSSRASTSAPESTSTRPSPPPRQRVRRNHPRTAPRPGRLAFRSASGRERGATAVELAVVRSVVQRRRPVLVAVPHRSTVPHQRLHDRRVPVSRCLEQRLSPPRSAPRLSRRGKHLLQPPPPTRSNLIWSGGQHAFARLATPEAGPSHRKPRARARRSAAPSARGAAFHARGRQVRGGRRGRCTVLPYLFGRSVRLRATSRACCTRSMQHSSCTPRARSRRVARTRRRRRAAQAKAHGGG